MKTLLTNARIVTDGTILDESKVLVADGKILAVGDLRQCATDEILDLQGNYLAPGFIDLHCHGGDGYEFIDATEEAFLTACAIHAAHGRVLTFGLGLGFFAYHASEKENVESVTVVDISDDVIDLFQTHILSQFPHKEKIKLIKSDAFAFAETQMQGNFDFVFADIWHDAGDGQELYLRMKEIAAKHPEIDFTYWLEDTIKCYLDKDLWDL